MKAKNFVVFLIFIFTCTLHAEKQSKDAVQRKGRHVTLPAWDKKAPSLGLNLPEGFTTKYQKGPDFDVHQFRHSEDIGVLSIYMGHHPDRKSAAVVEKFRKKFGKQEVEFQKTKTSYGSFTDGIVVDFFEGNKEDNIRTLKIHVFIHAKDDKFYSNVWPILESVVVTKKGGPKKD